MADATQPCNSNDEDTRDGIELAPEKRRFRVQEADVAVARWPVGSELPGLTVVDGALSPGQCAGFTAAATAAGFDDASVPWYQNRKLDWREKIFRRNTRAVVHATPEMQAALWRAVGPFVPASIDFGDYGTWDRHSTNDAWRFYRYQLTADDGAASEDCFPRHHDSATIKAPEFASWLTVLVYVSARGAFHGGGTAFYSSHRPVDSGALQQQQGTDGGLAPVATVRPTVGRVVLFYHTGPNRLLHAGTQLLRAGDVDIAGDATAADGGGPAVVGEKIVLRSDVMYRLRGDGPARNQLRPTPPYEEFLEGDAESGGVLRSSFVPPEPFPVPELHEVRAS